MAEGQPSPGTPSDSPSSRLDSWKDIAAHLKRDVSTVQRWEKREGMPVHRHLHDKAGSVYAFTSELDAWWKSRRARTPAGAADDPRDVEEDVPPTELVRAPSRSRSVVWVGIAIVAIAIAGVVAWFVRGTDYFWRNPLSNARFVRLTDFEGAEHAASISRDGKLVAFLADRDGPIDLWLTQPGTGRFYNLTHGAIQELVNPSIRTTGFSADGALVTMWVRRKTGSEGAGIDVWAVPTLGGEPRRYLEGAAEYDWSSDGTRLVYHTPGPGDPTFVKSNTAQEQKIFVAPSGLHSHFPVWSPDDRFIYFVYGTLPDEMDIWRIASTGGTPERVTSHYGRVSHPVFIDRRTLMYLASSSDGGGPWLYAIDVAERKSRRISYGIERYTSLAASADGKRLVVTAANPMNTIWRVALTDGRATGEPERVSLPTVHGRAPRYGDAAIVYVASHGDAESISTFAAPSATELHTPPHARILGGPAVSPDRKRVAFSTEENGAKRLYIANADGSATSMFPPSLEPNGTPAWSPDGRFLAVPARLNGAHCLARVSIDSKTFAPIISGFAADPAWSPDGSFVVYSGPDVGTTFHLRAVSINGRPRPVPNLTLTRGVRRLVFLPGTNALVVATGEVGHRDLRVIDLDTGQQRQLTNFGRDFIAGDFDISRDGKEIVVEREDDKSDIVLIER